MTLTGKARIAGVIGWPVSHSRSPALHGYWLGQYNIDGAVLPLAVAPEDLSLALKALPKMGFVGACVTLPHKEQTLTLIDDVDPAAQTIGAVNTIVVGNDGRLIGSNTDGFGFIENLRQSIPAWDPEGGSAVVLGAGGAARAVIHGLAAAGTGKICLVNRTESNARKVVEDLGDNIKAKIQVVPWSERSNELEDATLLVNTTSLGMQGQPALEISLARLGPNAIVSDIVYTPLETDLLAQAKQRGHPIVDGLGMLIHQARPGFKAWFGRDPEVTEGLRKFLIADLME